MFCLHGHSSFIERSAKWIKFSAVRASSPARFPNASTLANDPPTAPVLKGVSVMTYTGALATDDDNASRCGLQTEYQFHRRARIDTSCATNNKAAKLIGEISSSVKPATMTDVPGKSCCSKFPAVPKLPM